MVRRRHGIVTGYNPPGGQQVLLQRSITLSNQMDEVDRMTLFVKEVMETIGLKKTLAMQIRLAIEEAVVNVIKYAYPDLQKGDVVLCLTATNEMLEIVISDNGIPFDPTGNAAVDTSAPAEDRQVGGLGIHFIRQIMDAIDYERIDGRNILTMRKRIEGEVMNEHES